MHPVIERLLSRYGLMREELSLTRRKSIDRSKDNNKYKILIGPIAFPLRPHMIGLEDAQALVKTIAQRRAGSSTSHL